jgi:hypothetical protein
MTPAPVRPIGDREEASAPLKDDDESPGGFSRFRGEKWDDGLGSMAQMNVYGSVKQIHSTGQPR